MSTNTGKLPIEHYPFYPGLTHPELNTIRRVLYQHANPDIYNVHEDKKLKEQCQVLLDRLPTPDFYKT